MKIGCCLNTLAGAQDITGIAQLENIVAAGFEYVEMPLAQMMELKEDQFSDIVKRIEDSGLACEACNNFFPVYMRLTGMKLDRTAILRYLDEALSRARRLNVSVIVFGSPAAKNVPDGFPREIALMQIIEMLHLIDERADGIKIAIEPVCAKEANILYTVEEGAMLGRVTRGKNIKLLADFYHMAVENEPMSDILAGKDMLVHTHIANPNGRIYPRPDDCVDYKSFFDALSFIGYTGRVSVEAFTPDPKTAAAPAIAALRQAGA